jgi:hypothetical protein
MTVGASRRAVVGKSFKKDEFYEKYGKPARSWTLARTPTWFTSARTAMRS